MRPPTASTTPEKSVNWRMPFVEVELKQPATSMITVHNTPLPVLSALLHAARRVMHLRLCVSMCRAVGDAHGEGKRTCIGEEELKLAEDMAIREEPH